MKQKVANKIWAISKAVLGQGVNFWWWIDYICWVCLKLLWFPELSKTPYMTGGKQHIISELW